MSATGGSSGPCICRGSGTPTRCCFQAWLGKGCANWGGASLPALEPFSWECSTAPTGARSRPWPGWSGGLRSCVGLASGSHQSAPGRNTEVSFSPSSSRRPTLGVLAGQGLCLQRLSLLVLFTGLCADGHRGGKFCASVLGSPTRETLKAGSRVFQG